MSGRSLATAAIRHCRKKLPTQNPPALITNDQKIRGLILYERSHPKILLSMTVEALFRRSLGTARAQGARVFELRAAGSLARFLAQRGAAGDEARQILERAIRDIPEPSPTRDLDDARAALDELMIGS